MKKLIVLILLGSASLVPATVLANDTQCVGALAGTHANVIVPSGATCTISGAIVTGDVKVYGSLNVFAPTTIAGNIQAEPGHGFMRLWGGNVVVHGNVQVKGQVGAINAGYLAGTRINGNFQWEENNGLLIATAGTIGQDLQMFKNTGGGSITGNVIRGNLQCKENVPPPTGIANVVMGKKEDQCSAF